MRRLFGITVLLFAANIWAQEPMTVLFGQQWLNGHGWHLLDAKAKIMYLTAFNEGSGIAIINWLSTGSPKPTTQEFKRQESFYTSDAAFTTDETSDQIDKFYAVDANLEIPVAHAVLYVIHKFRGATSQELAAYNLKLRKMVAEKSGHIAPPIKAR